MLPVVFEEFELVCTFLLFFSCHYRLLIGKRSTLAKIWGGYSPPSTIGFYGPVCLYSNLVQEILLKVLCFRL